MTLRTICQDAAAEVKYPPPMAIFGNADPEVVMLLRLAQRVGRDVLSRGLWPTRRARHQWTAAAGEVQPGSLPSDFGRWVPKSMWRRDARMMLIGPLDGSEWASVSAQAVTGGGPCWWTRQGQQVRVWPPADGGETLAVEYFSDAFCASADGVPQRAWQADTDVGLVAEELLTLGLVAFALRADGQPFQSAMADYERMLWRLSRQEQPMSMLRTEIPAAMPWASWR